MSDHIRNGFRVIALGLSAALVCVPAAASPAQAGLDGAARTQITDVRRASTGTARVHEGRRYRAGAAKRRAWGRARRNKLTARAMMPRYRWRSARQFGCLERLWARESGWNERARNGATGAHGIPQALPGSKMASAGPDWRSNPRTQIRWGLRYIKHRFGTPCGAWSHFRSAGWY
ncbi:lytic transglycosylase domain-containing protein [Actinomadura xylanilytica]|uniref:aggregation-promoting factor C-terminal-like domain-containing protein n=1 Tax=Actinomadura xylanilytica TaxID=887459 RepID=UPI00255B0243|nr:lytic transglycosylase domain-containing protein [Actinomadura xylanilytica]MDL4772261.1 lytic transglycosylase domain-containing protein [Actinomadura xylanilytica]